MGRRGEPRPTGGVLGLRMCVYPHPEVGGAMNAHLTFDEKYELASLLDTPRSDDFGL